jgi:hypothetical protein
MHKSISILLVLFNFVQFVLTAQNNSNYYMSWNINHAENKITPSIPITKEEAKVVNCYLVTFDYKQRLINVKYFFSGKPSNYGDYGAFEMIRNYYNGYYTETFKNTEGQFIVNSNNISLKKYYLNKKGYWVKKENYNNHKLMEQGVAVSKVTRNKNNEIATEIQFSAVGDTIPDGNGFAIVHFTYNNDGLMLSRQNKNKKGNVINGTRDYATVLFQFDQNGMFFEEQFLDENNRLFLHPAFDLAKINWRSFNKYGKPSIIYYIDIDGYPHRERAYGKIEYRSNMTRKSITYYDRIGEKTEDQNGIAMSVYNYNSDGKYLGKTNFNLKNEVVN